MRYSMLPSAQRPKHRPPAPHSQIRSIAQARTDDRWQPDLLTRAVAAAACDNFQMIEFPLLIRFSPRFVWTLGCQIMVKRIFAGRSGAATISQPQPLAYDLRLCRYAHFRVRFGGVTHG